MLNSYYNTYFSSNVNNEMANLANAILSGYSSHTIGNCTNEEFDRILSILPFEYPLTYKVFMNEYVVSNGNIQFNYHECDDNLFVEKLNEIIQEIQMKITYQDTQYDIVQKIYDYITTNFEYDLEVLDDLNHLNLNDKNAVREFNNIHGQSFNLYGIVVNRKGVCAALCQLFKYLLYSFGIESTCILGNYVKNGETIAMGHSVILVEIDGECAFVDIAGGMHNSTCLNVTLYNKFLVDFDIISTVINPLYEEYVFDNVSSNLGYYYQNDLVFDSIDKVRIKISSIVSHAKQKVIYMLYTGNFASDRLLKKIIDEIVVYKKGDVYSYNTYIQNGNIVIKIYKEKR